MRRIFILFGLTLSFFTLVPIGRAQIQIGKIKVTVTDQAGALVPDAAVTLENAVTNFRGVAVPQGRGEYVFNDLPFNSYTIRVNANNFAEAAQNVVVNSNLPVAAEFKLVIAGASEAVEVQAGETLVRTDSSSTETIVDESFISRLPGVGGGNPPLQKVLATTPGWRMENDGLLHVRGVDDGTLYVIDGVPVTDRLDAVSGNSYDTEAIRSLTVITGDIPAEFGNRSGAVVNIESKPTANRPLTGALSFGGGSFRARDVNASFGGSLTEKIGLAGTLTGNGSRRFLDPVDPRNLNNRGGRLGLNIRSDWQPTPNDRLLFSLSLNGSDFRLTNELEQELAGQRQRQELRDDRQTLRWQRVWSPATITDVAFYRQSYGAKLFGSPSDTPLFAEQNRRHVRQGFIASLTHSWRGHTLKTGFEAAHVSLREFFTFAVTDEEEALEREISEAALEFDFDDPFVFRDRAARYQFSAYLQDNFQPLRNLTLNLGVRYDRSRLLVSDHQLSPRAGAVYYFPRTKTAVRGSFNRLYMPPQVENLLLASSEQARRLSPFAAPEEGGSGGAVIRPEKVSAYEVGFAQDVWGLFKLDGAYWHRTFRNYDDPNVFFNTTIIFPNSVASGFARGADVRLDVPARRGWSGYLSYSNARVLQYGPINGGLFLTDEFIEIGPGTPFVPDHDVRNALSFGVTYAPPKRRLWTSLGGRYETGVPLEVTEERLEELRSLPGADLVDFTRRRGKPWSVFHFSVGGSLIEREKYGVGAQFDLQNIANKRFVYNFGSPFSGTHFGYPRLWSGRVRFTFR